MFSLFFRKSRVCAARVMKSKFFTTINGVFYRFCTSFVTV
ncbi:hypothetical protein CLOSYM_01802 [[Clostridium] symbiosum ATCC 14940]|uniref:Uncharacterized protein n=1 Tax=[Clostridium] symbiosum ATCC 14940 TaxID=411472 RepID=A0ABC9TZB9_CLOSY|nr:hypothetical protein CLOSYM_01802 [[Clostridium] symbiosum ATCC 14940]